MIYITFTANQPPPINTPVTGRSESRPKSCRVPSSLKNHEPDDRKLTRSPTFVSERTYTALARGTRPSTSRTLTSIQSSKDVKVNHGSNRSDKHTIQPMPAMEPAFLEITKHSAGQYVWRLEVNVLWFYLSIWIFHWL